MNANTPSSELVRTAYRLFKQDTYYDKMDLFLRANVATYEASDSFQQWQDTLVTILDELRKEAPSPKSQRAIKAWLKHVDFRLLPKSVGLPNEDERKVRADDDTPRLISNVRTAKEYILKDDGGVQYFIYTPAELRMNKRDIPSHYTELTFSERLFPCLIAKSGPSSFEVTISCF